MIRAFIKIILFFAFLNNKVSASENEKYLNSITREHIQFAKDCLKINNIDKKNFCLNKLIFSSENFIKSNNNAFNHWDLSSINTYMYQLKNSLYYQWWSAFETQLLIIENLLND